MIDFSKRTALRAAACAAAALTLAACGQKDAPATGT